ncbi:MAG: GGDEF domain-containing protein [Bdellovibrionales bacterium]|jgi:diguanylate cyclase (GGDEF)-like protein|nr:GGDEF domain-containing protein [Bdellovibrionales bacterium]
MTAQIAEIVLNETAGITPFLQPELNAAQRLHSTTAALLSDTQSRLSAAEKQIAAQEKRIRELEAIAVTDSLTGVMNRRGFESFFTQERERQRRREDTQPGCLLLIDLDLFKAINDTHGHDAGDACLREVAEILSRNLRLLDGIARLGGDEFAVFLTDTDMEKAAKRIAILRTELNRIILRYNGVTLRFGASLGAVAVDTRTSYTELYRAADRALYTDKLERHRKRSNV